MTNLEEAWGDHLMSTHKPDLAVAHYIEAGRMSTALTAAVDAQQWDKAADILDVVGQNDVSQDQFQQLGRYYASIKQIDKAERFFLQGKLSMDVIKMHIDAGQLNKLGFFCQVRN